MKKRLDEKQGAWTATFAKMNRRGGASTMAKQLIMSSKARRSKAVTLPKLKCLEKPEET